MMSSHGGDRVRAQIAFADHRIDAIGAALCLLFRKPVAHQHALEPGFRTFIAPSGCILRRDLGERVTHFPAQIFCDTEAAIHTVRRAFGCGRTRVIVVRARFAADLQPARELIVAQCREPHHAHTLRVQRRMRIPQLRQHGFGADADRSEILCRHARSDMVGERIVPENIIRRIAGRRSEQRTDIAQPVECIGVALVDRTEKRCGKRPVPDCIVHGLCLPRARRGIRNGRPGCFVQRFAVIVPDGHEHPMRICRRFSVSRKLGNVRVGCRQVGEDFVPIRRSRCDERNVSTMPDDIEVRTVRFLHSVVKGDDDRLRRDQIEDGVILLDGIVPNHRPHAAREKAGHGTDVGGIGLRRARCAAATQIDRLVGADMQKRSGRRRVDNRFHERSKIRVRLRIALCEQIAVRQFCQRRERLPLERFVHVCERLLLGNERDVETTRVHGKLVQLRGRPAIR